MPRHAAFAPAGAILALALVPARPGAGHGALDPAYLNDTLGKLMIRKLREDSTASRGGRRAWRKFHDNFLSYGGPPIPPARQQMLGGGAVFEDAR